MAFFRWLTETWADSLAGAAVVHVAAHGEANALRPSRSGLRLENPTSGNADVLLRPTHVRAHQIGAAALGAPLAVLSACESAAGRRTHGEGVLGLSSAFLLAGCRTVVSTLWTVDDAVTARLMEIFYEGLAAGRSVDRALLDAQARIRSRPRTAHPYYWAGFVVIGDGSTAVDLEARSAPLRTLRWVWLLPIVAACGVVLVIFRQKSPSPV